MHSRISEWGSTPRRKTPEWTVSSAERAVPRTPRAAPGRCATATRATTRAIAGVAHVTGHAGPVWSEFHHTAHREDRGILQPDSGIGCKRIGRAAARTKDVL